MTADGGTTIEYISGDTGLGNERVTNGSFVDESLG